MGTKEYKAQAFEYTCGSEYFIGSGTVFSNSINEAITKAKDGAYNNVVKAEAEEGDGTGGTPILATIMVWKRGKLIINRTY